MLVTSGIWALFVALTITFPIRRGPMGFAVYVATMACNEIPFVLLLVFAASIVAVGASDDSVSGASLASAIVLIVLVAAGMLWLQLRVLAVPPALTAALAGQLGPTWRGNRLASTGSRRAWPLGILMPFQRRIRGVWRQRNIPYGPGAAHLLDLYERRDGTASGPVLVHFHGGGFVQGGKSREGVALLNQLADHGWLCVSANYRLRGAGAFPNSLVDAKRAIVWARTRATETGCTDTRVFLVGDSAGAHLAVSAALASNDPILQPGFEHADTEVAGAVSLYGYLGARSADPRSALANLARADAPPLFLIHGAADTALPPGHARAVAAALQEPSTNPVVYAELPATQHGFDLFASVRARLVADAVEDFLIWCRSRSGGS